MTQKAKELIDSYVWEIGPDDEISLVKRNERDPRKRHYDFYDLPDDLLSKILVNEFDRIF